MNTSSKQSTASFSSTIFSRFEMDFATLRKEAVLSKSLNAAAGPTFVFAKKPSNVFCLPTCNSSGNSKINKRTPMVFFDNAADAVEAGLKPCGECNPELSAINVGDSVIDSTVNMVNASIGLPSATTMATSSTPAPDFFSTDTFLPAFPDSPANNELLGNFGPAEDLQTTDLTDRIPDLLVGDDGEPVSMAPSLFSHPTDTMNSFSNIPKHSSMGHPMGHSRSSSIMTANENQLSSMDVLAWRPRRASISNGHISVASSYVDQMVALAKDGYDEEAVSPVSTPDRSNRQHSASSGKKSLGPKVSANRVAKDEKHGRGEGDHARLVDEACRSIAAAAAAAAASAAAAAAVDGGAAEGDGKDNGYNLAQGKIALTNSRSNGFKDAGKSITDLRQPLKLQRKKRRGGIMGFKELAAKAGLSPWHFHRVFRSVTGLTPKAYGEACWNAVIADPSLPVAIANGSAVPPLPNVSEDKSKAKSSPLATPAVKLEQPSKVRSRPQFDHSPSEYSACTLDNTPTDSTPLSTSSGSLSSGTLTSMTSMSSIPTSNSMRGGLSTPGSENDKPWVSMSLSANPLFPVVTNNERGFDSTITADAMSPVVTTDSELMKNTPSTMPSLSMYGVSASDNASQVTTPSMEVFANSLMIPGLNNPVTTALTGEEQSLPATMGGWDMLAGNPFNMQPVTTPIPHQFQSNDNTSGGLSLDSPAVNAEPIRDNLKQWGDMNDMVISS